MNSFLVLFLIKGIIIGSIYALISLGFNVIYRTTGVLNFAQGEFVMVGGVVSAWVVASLGWPIPAAIALGMAASTLVGLLLYRLAIHPARKATPVTHLIITIGASIIIKTVVSLVWGTEPFHLSALKEGDLTIGGTSIDCQSLLIVGVAAVCMILLAVFFRFTTSGRLMKACSENPEAAQLCGVSVQRMSLASFGLSALLGGIGGIMVTPMLGMDFGSGTGLGLKGFAAAILGGLGNPVGGVVGGLLIGILEQYSCWYSSAYKETLALAIVVVILLLRPRGLLTK